MLIYPGRSGEARAFALTGLARATIGRGRECDVVLEDSRASRVHARVESLGDDYYIRDAGSSNGTFLNGLRLADATYSLRPGDVVEIGRTVLACRGSGEAEPELSPEREPDVATPSAVPLALGELQLDALLRLDAGRRAALAASVGGAFENVSRSVGLRRVLDVVAAHLEVPQVAVFLEVGSSLELVSARPGPKEVAWLAPLAGRAFESSQAWLQAVPAGAPRGDASGRTVLETRESLATAPLVHRGQRVGALAVGRVGTRLDGGDVVLLAFLGDRVVEALAAGGANPDATPFGTAI